LEKQNGKKILAKILPYVGDVFLGFEVFSLLTIKDGENNLLFDFIVDLAGNGAPSFIRLEGEIKDGQDVWRAKLVPLNNSSGSGDSGIVEDEIVYIPMNFVFSEDSEIIGLTLTDDDYESITSYINNKKLPFLLASSDVANIRV
jgi:hypothetical protein